MSNIRTVKKTYIITCVIPNAPLNLKFFKALQQYEAFVPNTELLIYPTNLKMSEGISSPEIIGAYFGNGDKALNHSVKVLDLGIRHTVTNPVSGAFTSCSIVPAPVMMKRSLPRSYKQNKMPKGVWSTGTLSLPIGYKHSKSEAFAKNRHINNGMGALVVEVVDNRVFQARHIDWDEKNNCFYDVPHLQEVLKFTPTTVEVSFAEAISAGDTHENHIHKACWDWTDELVKNFKVKNFWFHDLFDGGDSYFLNHHGVNNSITREATTMSAKTELNNYIKFLEEKTTKGHWWNVKKHIVKSNHDEFLDKFLSDESRLSKLLSQYEFFLLSAQFDKCKLVEETIEVYKECREYLKQGKNPIKEYTLARAPHLADSIRWGELDSSFILGEFEMDNHGHSGANGARSGGKNHGRSITGHTHVDERLANGNQVNGAGCYLNPGYTNASGLSSWSLTHSLVYPNFKATLLTFVE